MATLIRTFSQNPNAKNQVVMSKNEKLKMYDIIMKAFLCKYQFEQAKLANTENTNGKDLKDFRVFNKLVNQINSNINNPVARKYVVDTINNIKNNDFSKDCVKESYKTIYEWFHPDKLKGQIFRNNLVHNNKTVDFETVFTLCNNTAITPEAPLFTEIKDAYAQFEKAYNEFIR